LFSIINLLIIFKNFNENKIVADLVFSQEQNTGIIDENEIQLVNQTEEITQLELKKYNILYPLPFEQMDQEERLLYKQKYIQNIRERDNYNREDVSDCFANSTCLTLSCCSTHGFFFAISEMAKIPTCIEFTIPLTIVAGCFVFGGVLQCPKDVIKCPARSLNSLGYFIKDFCTKTRTTDLSSNEDLIYIDSENNKKLKEEFEKIKTTKILYNSEEKKYYITQPSTILNNNYLENPRNQTTQTRQFIPSQLLMQ